MTVIDTDDQDPLPPLWGFVDPLFQDLDYLTRFYMSYCRQLATSILNGTNWTLTWKIS